jgi:putative acetyltransferase
MPPSTLVLVNVRLEGPHDREAVRAVHLAAFDGNPHASRDHARVVADLVDDLRAAVTRGEGLSLVACEGDEVVGHVMFSPSLLDAPARLVPVQVLSPIGVLPAWQGRGVGSALIRKGLELLAERAVPLVFLEGAPQYYSRFGFAPGAEQGFRKPSLRIPDAGFQAIRLPAYEEWMTGTLVYSDAFWRHDLVGLRDQDAEGGGVAARSSTSACQYSATPSGRPE